MSSKSVGEQVKQLNDLKNYLRKEITVRTMDEYGAENTVKGKLERILGDDAIIVSNRTNEHGLIIYNLPFVYGAAGIMNIKDKDGNTIFYNDIMNRSLIKEI